MCYHSGLRVLSSDFLQLPPISELDILKDIKRLRPSKSVGVDGLRGFAMKGSHFRMQWKRAVIVPILKNAIVIPFVIIDRFIF